VTPHRRGVTVALVGETEWHLSIAPAWSRSVIPLEDSMSLFRRALAAVSVSGVALVAMSVAPTIASAHPRPSAVYVLSNQTAGNQVLIFSRAADGSLTAAGSVDAGGTGTSGGLGSQGAIVVDDAGRYVYAVNAGSGSIASFRVVPTGLERVDVEPSGGTTPTSVTVHDDVLYVLNAGGDGSIVGFRTHHGNLRQLPGSARPLSGTGTAPAQVAFTPDGDALVVTERATQKIDLYDVGRDGYADGPTVVPSVGVTPFGFGFAKDDHLIVSEAFGGAPDASAVSSYQLDDASLRTVSASVPTTETAACWIAVTGNGRYAYAGNAGGSVSGYRVSPDGALTLLDADGRTAAPGAGALDLAMAGNSQFLYARLGNGSIAGWAIGHDGSLTPVTTAGGLPAGAAGIAAT
jgi:6-phosphogluconolactonase (cycloisomerase 2 family)